MGNDKNKKARIICILAIVFYLLTSVVAFASIGTDDSESGGEDLFLGLSVFNMNDANQDIATVEYNELAEDKAEPSEAEPSEAEPSETEPSEAEPEKEESLEEVLDNAASEETHEETDQADDGEEYYSFTAVTGSSMNLNIRMTADIRSKIVSTIPRGKTGYILELGDDWSKVTYNGYEGYCSNEYLNMKKISKEEYEEGLKQIDESGREADTGQSEET